MEGRAAGSYRGLVEEQLAQLTAIREYVSASILRCLRRSSFLWLMDRGASAAMLVIEMLKKF
jgi:hypothetical protein